MSSVSYFILFFFRKSAIAANVTSFAIKLEFFTRLEKIDLLINYFCFIFASSVSLGNLF